MLCGEERLATPVYTACCSDLMSDVLAFVNEKTVLITGLTNHHVLRTADMLDLKCLVFARGKVPGEELLEQAQEQGLVVDDHPRDRLYRLRAFVSGRAARRAHRMAGKRGAEMTALIHQEYPIAAEDYTRAGEASADDQAHAQAAGRGQHACCAAWPWPAMRWS